MLSREIKKSSIHTFKQPPPPQIVLAKLTNFFFFFIGMVVNFNRKGLDVIKKITSAVRMLIDFEFKNCDRLTETLWHQKTNIDL